MYGCVFFVWAQDIIILFNWYKYALVLIVYLYKIRSLITFSGSQFPPSKGMLKLN